MRRADNNNRQRGPPLQHSTPDQERVSKRPTQVSKACTPLKQGRRLEAIVYRECPRVQANKEIQEKDGKSFLAHYNTANKVIAPFTPQQY